MDLNISAANCEVINSNTFKIESNIKNLKISDQNNTLTVKTEKRVGFDGDKLIFKLYIPEHMIFEKVYIVTGVGKMNIKELSADELYFELGAGSAELENIVSKSKAKIDGGAGQLIIKNASLSNAEIDMGVGEFKYSGDLMGKSEIDSGVGAVSLELIGDMLDYEFAIDKGLGNISIDGKKLSDDEIYGSGENKIDLSNGVGEIKVSFDK